MAKTGGPGGKKAGAGGGREKKGGLKVSTAAAQVVNLAARANGLSVEELFDRKDVRTFFNHILLEGMRDAGLLPDGPRT